MNGRILYAMPGHKANQSVQQQLESAGYSVVVARDMATAGQLVKAEPLDLVLIEMSMFGAEGIDLLNSIRSLTFANRLPLIILGSAYADDECIRGLEAGADGFIARPFSMAVLLAQINALLRRVKKVKNVNKRLEENNFYAG